MIGPFKWEMFREKEGKCLHVFTGMCFKSHLRFGRYFPIQIKLSNFYRQAKF